MSRAAARAIAIGLALFAALPVIAQDSAVQERLAAVKLVMALNAQKLHQYQWTETTQITLNGDQRPPTQASCQYGPDGKVQKTPIGSPPAPSGGPLMRRIIEKKEAEMKQYMGDVKAVLALYLPPDPQKMETGQTGGESLREFCTAQRREFGFQQLCPAGGSDDPHLRYHRQKGRFLKYQYLHGRVAGSGDLAGADGEPAGWHELLRSRRF